MKATKTNQPYSEKELKGFMRHLAKSGAITFYIQKNGKNHSLNGCESENENFRPTIPFRNFVAELMSEAYPAFKTDGLYSVELSLGEDEPFVLSYFKIELAS